MSVSLLLIPLALLLLAAAVGAFFWAVDNDQFEDLDHVADHALDDAPPETSDPAPPAVTDGSLPSEPRGP